MKQLMKIYEAMQAQVQVDEDIRRPSPALSDFMQRHDIDPDEVSWLGSGDFGEAYSIGDGRVIKETRSDSEYQLAQVMIEKGDIPALEGFAKYYVAEEIDGLYYMVMEELEHDSSAEDLFYELQSLLSEQGLDITYINSFDEDDLDYELSDDLQQFILDMRSIVYSYRYLGVQTPDIKPDNIGIAQDGTWKAFDIHDKAYGR